MEGNKIIKTRAERERERGFRFKRDTTGGVRNERTQKRRKDQKN